jgi:hypothetical protein
MRETSDLPGFIQEILSYNFVGICIGIIITAIIRLICLNVKKLIPFIQKITVIYFVVEVILIIFSSYLAYNLKYQFYIFISLVIAWSFLIATCFNLKTILGQGSTNSGDCIVKKRIENKIVNKSEYDQIFNGPIDEKNTILKEALDRAWKCRDFEVEKFWQRTAFFWTLIAAIFVGYTSVKTESVIDLYLILLGFLFSLAWLLVIKGNRAWQLNWEMHIDKLENDITGPLHKIIFYKRKTVFYSISAINEVLAVIVIIFWLGLLVYYCIQRKWATGFGDIDWEMTIALLLTIIFSIVLIFGYTRYPFSADESNIPPQEDGIFIDRTKQKES